MATQAKSRSSSAAKRRLPEWAVWTIVGAVLILAVTAFFYFRAHPGGEPGQVLLSGIPSEVGPDAAFILLSRDALFVDIRTADEWNANHIANSVSIPLDELPGRLSEIPADNLIVVIDRTGELGPQGRDLLLANGYSRVTTVTGGIDAWVAAGYSIQGIVSY